MAMFEDDMVVVIAATVLTVIVEATTDVDYSDDTNAEVVLMVDGDVVLLEIIELLPLPF